MRTDNLPNSENVEDRRDDKPTKRHPMTLAEALAAADGNVPRGRAEPMTPDGHSKLAKDAGVDDIAR